MPRKMDLSTESLKKLIVKTALEVKDGSLDPKRGNVAITGFRAAVYSNQVIAGEERLLVDKQLAENMKELNRFINEGGTLPELPEIVEEVTEADEENNV